MSLSPQGREKILKEIADKPYDVIVIGGGITGAGIALDASSRGLKVLLLEKGDFASGTSSRSTKLIHGGLRYLEQYQFSLVKETAQERKILYRLAPHLISKEKMLLPFFKNGHLPKWKVSLGLSIYDFLGKVEKEEKNTILDRQQTIAKEPLLGATPTLGAGFYTEYRTDDARLTIEVIKTAVRHGADCLNYAPVKDFLIVDNKLCGVTFSDSNSKKEFSIQAKQMVNATGIWIDEFRKKEKNDVENLLVYSKGVHLVFSKERFPLNNPIYFGNDDGRFIFAIPRGENTYVGTTETVYPSNKLDHPNIEKEDVLYLIDATNKLFPQLKLQEKDVVSGWSGVRPLINEKGKPTSNVSRKDEILIGDKGLITIAGGKLTGYRHMAEKVVDVLMKKMNKTEACKTKQIPLTERILSTELRNHLVSKGRKMGFETNKIENLLNKYGSNTSLILDKCESLSGTDRLLQAEIWYGVHFEGVQTISDFLIRRTGMLYFEKEKIKAIQEKIAQLLKVELNWGDETYVRMLMEFDANAK